MPTVLIEKPPEVDGSSREVVPAPVVEVLESTQGQAVCQSRKALWRRVFEGHQEFLGWTPD